MITTTLLLLLAATMLGEVEVLHSDQAALAVYEVAMNRVESSAFPDTLQEVLLSGFNGWKRMEMKRRSEFDDRYMALAEQALEGAHEWDHKALYMLSADDCGTLGADLAQAVKSYRRGRWAVYLYEDWPCSKKGGES